MTAPRPLKTRPTIEVPQSDSVQYSFSLTISPIHLVSQIVELTAEYRVLDKLGVDLIGEGGKVTQESEFLPDETFTVFEAGETLLRLQNRHEYRVHLGCSTWRSSRSNRWNKLGV